MSEQADKTHPEYWDGVDKARGEQLGLPPLTVDQKRREMAEAKRQILKNPSKTLGSPRAGDRTAEQLREGNRLDSLMRQDAFIGKLSARCQRQKRELRRLNRVIQQMSWKLHVKRRRAWAEAFHPDPFSPIVIGGVTTAVLLLIVAVLMFS